MLVFDPATSIDLSTDLWHDVACASPETTQFICKTQATGKDQIPDIYHVSTVPDEGLDRKCNRLTEI